MTIQHTPGPWQWVNPIDDAPWDGDRLQYASLRTVEKFGKSETVVRNGEHYTSFALPKFILDATDVAEDAEGEANARLIAAAPDHHAVALELRRLMLVIESAVRHGDPKNHTAVTALLIANVDAIEKATGATP